MKINITQIPQEGLFLEEEVNPAQLDLETELIKFRSSLKLKARIERITNALTVDLNMKAVLFSNCSRCLEEFEWEMDKNVWFNFPIDTGDIFIDLSEAVREEIIPDYPIKPLCKNGCKGLCPKCGKNKNEGGCNCGST